MPIKRDQITENRLIHPGEILAQELKERGIKQSEFAEELLMAYSQLNEIIKGKRSISADLAIILDAALGIPAVFWTNLQAKYDLEVALVKKTNLEKADLIRWKKQIKQWIAFSYFKEEQVLIDLREKDEQKIKEIFKVNQIEDIPKVIEAGNYSRFRKSEFFVTDPINLTSWIKYIEYLSEKEQVRDFTLENQNELILKLKKILMGTHVVEKTRKQLADFGIIFIYKGKPEKVPVDGMAFHNGKNPVIALTGRYKRIDNFAFTLFHELGHIYLHIKNKKNVEPFIDNLENKQAQTGLEEAQANEYAQKNLIPEDKWQKIKDSYHFDDVSINRFAQEIGVPAAIIRGRLCNEYLVSYKASTTIEYAIY
ncbi:HigA family addiction module antidote protein [Rhodocytophaga rosea]|uniref:HigA family addiction module antidote protein n=1 Tax=Rhodocytophaga rosea TaxID=2704465 RepID=A0A6C0GBR2_9BACT|nr:HigA family addiction module antitoxin [Rhodocytophaga rosea]QHT65385.1 HigA family addiction module antidote protein [Rhodocytophaga rosea]